MSRRWVFSILAAAVLAVGVLGGTVMAQDSGDGGDGGTKVTVTGGIMERVAEKLGIAEEDLRTAFDEAKAELKDERLEQRIDDLVADGRLTEAEGQELLDWYRSRPEVLEGRGGLRGFGPHGFGRRGGHGFMFRFGGRGMFENSAPVVEGFSPGEATSL